MASAPKLEEAAQFPSFFWRRLNIAVSSLVNRIFAAGNTPGVKLEARQGCCKEVLSLFNPLKDEVESEEVSLLTTTIVCVNEAEVLTWSLGNAADVN